MPAEIAPFMTLTGLLSARTLPRLIAPIYIARAELKTFLSETETVTRLPAGGHTAVLWPIPDPGGGHIFVPCFSGDPDVVCLPSGDRNAGSTALICNCYRGIGDRDVLTPIEPAKKDPCKFVITGKGVLTCSGKCPVSGKPCKPKVKQQPNGMFKLVCAC